MGIVWVVKRKRLAFPDALGLAAEAADRWAGPSTSRLEFGFTLRLNSYSLSLRGAGGGG